MAKNNLNLPKDATFKGPASIWKRALAFAIDLLILDFVIGGFYRSLIAKLLPTDIPSYNFFSANPKITSLISLITMFFGLLALLYFSIMEYKTGQTIGKMFVNIRVESDDSQFTYWQAITRSAYFIIFFPFFLLWIIDPIFMFFSKDKRRLMEVISRTRTVETYFLNPVQEV